MRKKSVAWSLLNNISVQTSMSWNILRERSRAKAVDRLGIMSTPTEPGFDRFVEQAAAGFAAPISFLTLITTETMWVKASSGFELQCMPRRDSFCTHVLGRSEPLEVCDALADRRFRKLPPVTGKPHIRYYIGAPLHLACGADAGALCVIDTRPRPPASRDQRAYLVGLARQAAHALERQAHIRGTVAA